MDEDLLISELVDSDDDVDIDLEIAFSDFPVLGSSRLLGALWPRPKIGEESNLNGGLNESETTFDNYFPTKELSSSGSSETLHASTDYIFSYSENEFLQQFRVSRSTAKLLIKNFRADTLSNSGPTELQRGSPGIQILSVLLFLGQASISVEDVCSQFDLKPEQFKESLRKVIMFLNNAKAKEMHCLNGNNKQSSKKYYALNHGFQGVIGCIGALRIKVKSCEEGVETDCTGRIVVLQVVVNEKANFTDVYVCETASTNAGVLHKSPLYKMLPTICSDNEYLLGGAGYPCTQHILSPYFDNVSITGGQVYFNLRLASALQTVDTASSLLTQRFRKLSNLKLPNRINVTQLITACSVLHNISNNDDFKNVYEPSCEANLIDNGLMTRNSEELQFEQIPSSEQGLTLRDQVCEELLEE